MDASIPSQQPEHAATHIDAAAEEQPPGIFGLLLASALLAFGLYCLFLEWQPLKANGVASEATTRKPALPEHPPPTAKAQVAAAQQQSYVDVGARGAFGTGTMMDSYVDVGPTDVDADFELVGKAKWHETQFAKSS